MKWLFLLLLAANLAYYFLGGDSAPETTSEPTTIAAGTPTILLLHEAEQQGLYPLPDQAPAPVTAPIPVPDSAEPTPAQASPPTADDLHRAVYPEGDDGDAPTPPALLDPPLPPKGQAKQAETATPNQASCFRIGPFDQVATAKAAGKRMMELGFRGRLLQTTAQHSSDYQVYLGPYSDPDERQFAIDELIDAGITDISFGRGKDGNTLIIGSYPNRELTKPVIATLQTLGYNPHIKKRPKPIRRFYLDLEALDGSGSPSPRDRLTTAFPDIGLKSSACRR